MLLNAPSIARRKSQTVSLQAPIAGLNLKDSWATAGGDHALRLNNWVCRRDGLQVRLGSILVNAGNGDAVTAVFSFPSHLLYATETALFGDGIQLVGGLNSGAWQSEMVVSGGGHWLMLCSGFDDPRVYNGASVGLAQITGVDKSKLFFPALHGQRLFFAIRDTLELCYLGLHSMHGPASIFPLGALCKKGGHVAGLASMSMDGGRNSNDQLVIVTSEGELIIYAGVIPDNAESFQLVGVWDMPKPVGNDPLVNLGGGILLLTETGMFRVSDLMQAPAEAENAIALTDKINNPAGTQYVQSARHGFSVLNMADGTQYVREAETGGWSRFYGLNATCWVEHEGKLIFGRSNGQVMEYGGQEDGVDPDDPLHDDDQPIPADFVQGYDEFGTDRQKRFSRARMVFEYAAPTMPAITMLTDYQEIPEVEEARVNANRPLWDDVVWGDYWLRHGAQIMTRWHDIRARGYAGAFSFATRTRAPMTYQRVDIRMEVLGI